MSRRQHLLRLERLSGHEWLRLLQDLVGRGSGARPASRAGGSNWANFIECVRSGKKENLNAPIEEGHISSALVHLANASYRLGRTLNFDPKTEQVIGDDEANQMLRGTYREPYVVPETV